jgi:AraC-like DNA-binding protein
MLVNQYMEQTVWKDTKEQFEIYTVFPGVQVGIYNIFVSCFHFAASSMCNTIKIDCCCNGEMECVLENDVHLRLEAGDAAVHLVPILDRYVRCPTRCYQGIRIEIDLNQAPKTMACILQEIPINLKAFEMMATQRNQCTIVHPALCLSKVIYMCGSISKERKVEFLKIKVLELLLLLGDTDSERTAKPCCCMSRMQMNAMEGLRHYLDTHFQEHLTLAELAVKYNMPLTTMKRCFRCICGVPIYTYLRRVRMKHAAKLLRHTDETVLAIAGAVGYDNGSKFAAAFRNVMGMSPGAYRRKAVESFQLNEE